MTDAETDAWSDLIDKHPIGFFPKTAEEQPKAIVEEVVTMKRMEFDDGRIGWYVDHPEFYADIEPDAETGKWSIFFRDRSGAEGYAEREHKEQPK